MRRVIMGEREEETDSYEREKRRNGKGKGWHQVLKGGLAGED